MLSRALPTQAADEKAGQPKLKVSIFSKHLQFLAGEELAKAAAEIGFDGITVTVRKGGHVEPERVRQDLPPLVRIIRQHGMEVPAIMTDIVDVQTPYTEDILKTMEQLGIRNYHWGNLRYAEDQSYDVQLDQLKSRVAKLAVLNSQFKVCGQYHIESGAGRVGSAVLDLYIILKGLDGKAVAVNYDLYHAVEAGGGGSWINSFRTLSPYVRCVALGDFDWGKDASGAWHSQLKPLGDGIVPLPQFFTMLAESGFSGLLELHVEYRLGGETDTKGTGVVDREAVYSGLKRDLRKVHEYQVQAHL